MLPHQRKLLFHYSHIFSSLWTILRNRMNFSSAQQWDGSSMIRSEQITFVSCTDHLQLLEPNAKHSCSWALCLWEYKVQVLMYCKFIVWECTDIKWSLHNGHNTVSLIHDNAQFPCWPNQQMNGTGRGRTNVYQKGAEAVLSYKVHQMILTMSMMISEAGSYFIM